MGLSGIVLFKILKIRFSNKSYLKQLFLHGLVEFLSEAVYRNIPKRRISIRIEMIELLWDYLEL